MARATSADASRILRTQLFTAAIVWLSTIAFWATGSHSFVKYVALSLAIFDSILVIYFWFRLQKLKVDETLAEEAQMLHPGSRPVADDDPEAAA
jgi:hypothetical protein